MSPIVSQLFIYPIKSCAGISVKEFQFDSKGPLFDRRWMLIDALSGKFLSQRKLARMSLIKTSIEEGGVYAEQTFNSSIKKTLLLPSEGVCRDVEVWSDQVKGYDCGDEAADWFSVLLDYPCRLVYQGDLERLADSKYAAEGTLVGFADGFPLLAVSRASIDFLNDSCESATISAENFRPNIVVDNTDIFAEDRWTSLSSDTLNMKVVKPCQRCVIPALNIETAEREEGILSVLMEHCRVEKKIFFGQNMTFEFSGQESLKVGQALHIHAPLE